MDLCNNSKLFKLPELCIIGGDYKERYFRINDLDNGGFMDTSNLEGKFALIPYGNRNGQPVYKCDLTTDPNDNTIFLLTLTSDDTINLSGKYIYQISIKASETKQQSFQGIMIIDRNIYPNAFASI